MCESVKVWKCGCDLNTDLSSQQMIVLSRGCWVGHLHVHIIAIHTILFTVCQLEKNSITLLIKTSFHCHVVNKCRYDYHSHVKFVQLVSCWPTLQILFYPTCRNLSGLAEECSGPAPSIPWGSNKTNPDWSNHFAEISNILGDLVGMNKNQFTMHLEKRNA